MSIYACSNCGSIDFGTVPTNVDAFDMIYSTNKSYCKNCGFEGIPLIFDDDKSYQDFLASLEGRSESLKPLYGLAPAFDKEVRKNPFAAAILSFLWPGLGQAYNNEVRKAWAFFILFILFFHFGGGYLIGVIVCVLFWFYAVSDAFLSASRTASVEDELDVSELDSMINDLNES